MKMSEKDLLMQYIVTQEFRLEDELNELRKRIRFRKITIEDNLEMILAQQRLNDFVEFSRNVLALLHVGREID